MADRYIPYYRVSTKRQGESGLGLEAQQVDVSMLIVERKGIEIAHYTEVETGKNPERPELAKAIAHAKLSNATLVVAKLDRLARNVAFTSALMESGVPFVCCE
jgi:DNA invertase Pin-like site-specific DNA recombinase